MYICWLKTVIILPIQNTVGICREITILIFHHITSRLVTVVKFIYAPVYVRAQLMSTLSSKFSKSANLFEILIWNSFLTSAKFSFPKIKSLHIKLCAARLLTDSLFLSFAVIKEWSVSHLATRKEWT